MIVITKLSTEYNFYRDYLLLTRERVLDSASQKPLLGTTFHCPSAYWDNCSMLRTPLKYRSCNPNDSN